MPTLRIAGDSLVWLRRRNGPGAGTVTGAHGSFADVLYPEKPYLIVNLERISWFFCLARRQSGKGHALRKHGGEKTFWVI